MTEAPREIWAEMVHESHPAYPYEGRFHVDQNAFGGTPYVRADAIPIPDARAIPEVEALVEAVRAEVDARALYLATAPDRGGMNGPKGQRKQALEAAQLRTIAALRKIEEGRG